MVVYQPVLNGICVVLLFFCVENRIRFCVVIHLHLFVDLHVFFPLAMSSINVLMAEERSFCCSSNTLSFAAHF